VDGKAAPGTVVTIRYAGDDETETFLLGAREIAATTDLTVYSPESPLGHALLGHGTGDTVSYTAPNGREIQVDLVDVAPFTG
jgi:transcription elongation factor GreA